MKREGGDHYLNLLKLIADKQQVQVPDDEVLKIIYLALVSEYLNKFEGINIYLKCRIIILKKSF